MPWTVAFALAACLVSAVASLSPEAAVASAVSTYAEAVVAFALADCLVSAVASSSLPISLSLMIRPCCRNRVRYVWRPPLSLLLPRWWMVAAIDVFDAAASVADAFMPNRSEDMVMVWRLIRLHDVYYLW